MKKFSIIFLVVCLFVSMFAIVTYASEPDAEAATVEAEPTAEPIPQVIDLSEYDDDTIAALYEQVKAEIVARRIEKTAHLDATDYVIGRDIPAGDYKLTKSDPDSFGVVRLVAEDGEEKLSKSTLGSSTADFAVFFTLEEGDTLSVAFPCDLTISTGVKFE